MKKAIIVYHSKTGTTKNYAYEIADYLNSKNIEPVIKDTAECSDEDIQTADFVFLGAWTHGLFIFLQHPDKPWVDFVKKMPSLENKKTVLFTTFLLATGSMFSRMKKALKGKSANVLLTLRSKTGEISDEDKEAINNFI